MNASKPLRQIIPSPQSSTFLCQTCRHRQRLPSRAPTHQQLRWTTSHDRKTRVPIKLANASEDIAEDPAENLPRWQRTPQAMQAPYRTRPVTPNSTWKVNEDPKVLDDVYLSILGRGGHQVLGEDVKWLAVTHKSFDHGRRGFNDRLAFLGKRMVDLQTSLALLRSELPAAQSSGEEPAEAIPTVDEYGRTPFEHKALQGLDSLTESTKQRCLAKEDIARLAHKYNLHKAVRWKPRQTRQLRSSGEDLILAQALYAVIGAVALQRGGDLAVQTIRQKILNPLGIL